MANFLGVQTRASFYSRVSRPGSPQHSQFVVTEYPGVNEEYFEWIALLESVLGARGRFVMIELGAGWGRWLVNASVALKLANPVPSLLIGVEAEPTHFQWMLDHFRDNGIDSSEHTLIRAAVSDSDGETWFYTGRPGEWYGQAIAPGPEKPLRFLRRPVCFRARAILSPLLQMIGTTLRKGRPSGFRDDESVRVEKVRAVSLNTLVRALDLVDQIDCDIQGAEYRVFASAVEQLSQKVRRVYIGTHDHGTETALRAFFLSLGWKPVYDYPVQQESLTAYGRVQFQDGVQYWVNPRLL